MFRLVLSVSSGTCGRAGITHHTQTQLPHISGNCFDTYTICYTRGTVIEDGGLDTTLERSFLDTNCYIRHQEAPKATPDLAFAMITQIIHGSRPSKQAVVKPMDLVVLKRR